MKNLWTTIMVKNMDESLKFYTEILDLKIDRQLETPELAIAFLGEGETKLELIKRKDFSDITYSGFVSTGFQIEDSKAFQKYLKEMNCEIDGPYKPNPHIEYFFITDPDGYKIQLVEVR